MRTFQSCLTSTGIGQPMKNPIIGATRMKRCINSSSGGCLKFAWRACPATRPGFFMMKEFVELDAEEICTAVGISTSNLNVVKRDGLACRPSSGSAVTPGDPVVKRQAARAVHHQVQQDGGPGAVGGVGIWVDKQLDGDRHAQQRQG